MRRRQINQMRAAGLLPPVSMHEREAWERERAAKAGPAKGQCKHCGEHIGRGLHIHEKHCRP